MTVTEYGLIIWSDNWYILLENFSTFSLYSYSSRILFYWLVYGNKVWNRWQYFPFSFSAMGLEVSIWSFIALVVTLESLPAQKGGNDLLLVCDKLCWQMAMWLILTVSPMITRREGKLSEATMIQYRKLEIMTILHGILSKRKQDNHYKIIHNDIQHLDLIHYKSTQLV